ncbi:MAG: iron chelate uptake ABC transporter family permease subunit [Limnobacter sp.]|nr:iron chelate uptake ABC transporter family permease subunit [Limnobacter sp.]
MNSRNRTVLILAGLLGLAMWVLVWSLQIGSSDVTLWGQSPVDQTIFWELRVPRVMQAFAVGGLLAMSGLLMQVLLKNPLADPYILGISGGAGLGGVLVAVSVGGFAAAWMMPVGAGIGAMAVVLLVFGLNNRSGLQSLDRLLLTGVAVSSVSTALVSLLLTFSGSDVFRGLVFWLLGELNGQNATVLLFAWCLMLMCCMPLARTMNAMVLGDDMARTLGVQVKQLRLGLYWLAALATGVAVAAGGMIGFVGLVVPHAMRLLLGSDNRLLIPAVAVAGGVFLTAADCVARSLIAPIQLPVGVVTALVGGPVFIWLLHRSGLCLRSLKKGGANSGGVEQHNKVQPSKAQSLSPSTTPLLSISGFSLSSNHRPVCNALDWDGHAGQVWAVIGNSGIGKSTLMRSLAGLQNDWCQQTGHIRYQGKRLGGIPLAERACHLAWMPQSDQVPFPCTVRDRVLAGLHPHGKPFSWETRQDLLEVSRALSRVQLNGVEARMLDTLSGGERRRVSLAAAMVQGTPIVLLDEPLSQLDWKHQIELAGLFKPWALERQGLMVWITHDPNFALRFSTHVLALCADGQIIQGPVAEVLTPSVLSRVYGCPIVSQHSPVLHFPAH